MIKLYAQVERLKQINEAISIFDYDSIEFFSSCVYTESPGYFNSDHYFGFDKDGLPIAHSHSDISVSVTHVAGNQRVLVRNLSSYPNISVTFKKSMCPDQIFYSFGFGATPLGRSFDISKDKHPELFLSEEDASYAILLGKEVIFGLPEYIKLIQPIVEFAVLADTIQKEKYNRKNC